MKLTATTRFHLVAEMNWPCLLVFWLILIHNIAITNSENAACHESGSSELSLWDYLPRTWCDVCIVDYDEDRDVNATVICHVTPRDHTQWRLADLRAALASLVESTGLEVSVDIRCQTGGIISLPNPMRAPGLVKLTVFNCRLLDKYADVKQPLLAGNHTRDWMRVQNISSCTWVNDPDDFEFVRDNLAKLTSEDFECGQDKTMVTYVYRNNSDEDHEVQHYGDDDHGASVDYVEVDEFLKSRSNTLNSNRPEKVPGKSYPDGASSVPVSDRNSTDSTKTRQHDQQTGQFWMPDGARTLSENRHNGSLSVSNVDNFVNDGTVNVSNDKDFKFNSKENAGVLKSQDLEKRRRSGHGDAESSTEDGRQGLDEGGERLRRSLPTVDVVGHSGSVSDEYLQTQIDLLDKQYRCKFVNLETVDESFSQQISNIDFQLLAQKSRYPKLALLNYTATRLTHVPRELLQSRLQFPRSKLGVIDLSRNFIREVGQIPSYPSGGISTTLVLQFNNITRISFSTFKRWASVPDFFVDVRNNPIHCGCELKKGLVVHLQNETEWTSSSAMAYYRRHLFVMTCSTPLQLSGMVIGSLRAEDLSCPGEVVLELRTILMAVMTVMAVLAVLLVLAVKYRKEVRILMYTRVYVLLPCGVHYLRPKDTQPEKIYDAFVAYAHQDSSWVLGSLLPHLEGDTPDSHLRGSRRRGPSRPCRLCIHQRDFIVGKPIIDNIVDSIAASRHTIVVLSKSFVQSGWAMEELQMAYRQSIDERTRHLVIVMLEEVPESDMTPVLRRCCQTFTYISVHDALFWDRLLYSIHAKENLKIRGSEVVSVNVTETAESEAKGDNCSSSEDSGPGQLPPLDEEFQRTIFSEAMRLMSVRSSGSRSSSSDTSVPLTPSQLNWERPLFEDV